MCGFLTHLKEGVSSTQNDEANSPTEKENQEEEKRKQIVDELSKISKQYSKIDLESPEKAKALAKKNDFYENLYEQSKDIGGTDGSPTTQESFSNSLGKLTLASIESERKYLKSKIENKESRFSFPAFTRKAIDKQRTDEMELQNDKHRLSHLERLDRKINEEISDPKVGDNS